MQVNGIFCRVPFHTNMQLSSCTRRWHLMQAVDLTAMLKRYSEVGDQARVSQILQADASIRAAACWFDLKCSLNAKAHRITFEFGGL